MPTRRSPDPAPSQPLREKAPPACWDRRPHSGLQLASAFLLTLSPRLRQQEEAELTIQDAPGRCPQRLPHRAGDGGQGRRGAAGILSALSGGAWCLSWRRQAVRRACLAPRRPAVSPLVGRPQACLWGCQDVRNPSAQLLRPWDFLVEPKEPRFCTMGHVGGWSDPHVPWGCHLRSLRALLPAARAPPRPLPSPAEESKALGEPRWASLGVEDFFWDVLSPRPGAAGGLSPVGEPGLRRSSPASPQGGEILSTWPAVRPQCGHMSPLFPFCDV